MTNDEKTYCVYKHTSPSGKVYIGITSQKPEKRWQNGAGYKNNEYFNRAIKKYGWSSFVHEILFVDLAIEDAAIKEKELISSYKSNNPLYGYNISSGGEGGAEGIIISEEERMRRSSHAKTYVGSNNPNYGNHKLAGENNPFFGKEHSDHTKQLLSNIAKERWNNEEYKKHMYEVHQNINAGVNNPRAKTTLQYDLNGSFIASWEYAKIAADTLGICVSGITQCCRGIRKSAGGFIWKYAD